MSPHQHAAELGGRVAKRETTMKGRIRKSHNAFETIDFEEPDSAFLRKHYKNQSTRSIVLQEAMQYLLAAIITFVIACLFYVLFIGTEYIGELRIVKYSHLINQGKTMEGLGVAIWTSLVVTLVPAILIIVFAPDAVGSGMADVIAYLNGSQTINGSNLLLPAIRYLGSFGIVVGGLFSGIDGPMARIDGLSDKDLDFNSGLKKSVASHALLDVLEQKRLRIFATLGASVAIAVIFRSPLGGVMFAIEIIGYLILSGFVRNGIKSDTDMYIQPALYPVNATCTLDPVAYDYLTYIAVGLGAAILGTLWNKLLSLIQTLRVRNLMPEKLGKRKRPFATRPSQFPFSTSSPSTDESPAAAFPEAKESRDFSGRWWRRAGWRLLDVAVLGLATNLVVVLVPVVPGLDPCVDLETPLDHVLPTLPSVCVRSFTDTREELFSDCLESITNNLVRYRIVLENPGLNITTLGSVEKDDSSQPHGSLEHNRILPGPFLPPTLQILHHRSTPSSPLALTRRLLMTRDDSPENLVKIMRRGGVGITPKPKEKVKYIPVDITNTTTLADLVPDLLSEANIIFYLMTDTEHGEEEEASCYYPLRTLLYATPDKQLRYLTLSLFTYYIALPTDLVIPNLIIGAIAGRLVGMLLNFIKGNKGRFLIDPGLFSMIGMAAMWSGTSRLAITVTVICLELTGDFENLTALLIVCLTAAWTTTFFEYSRFGGDSLYRTEMQGLGVLFLPHEPSETLRTITVASVAKLGDVVCLREKGATVEDVRRCLATRHNGFPIVREEVLDDGHVCISPTFSTTPPSSPLSMAGGVGPDVSQSQDEGGVMLRLRPVGIIHRATIVAVLEGMMHEKRGEAGKDQMRVDESNTTIHNFSSTPDLERNVGGVTFSTSLDTDPDTLDPSTPFDVSAVYNVSPTIVREDASADKVYRMVRQLGVRHVLVVDSSGYLVGIVTRKNLVAKLERRDLTRKRAPSFSFGHAGWGVWSEGVEFRGEPGHHRRGSVPVVTVKEVAPPVRQMSMPVGLGNGVGAESGVMASTLGLKRGVSWADSSAKGEGSVVLGGGFGALVEEPADEEEEMGGDMVEKPGKGGTRVLRQGLVEEPADEDKAGKGTVDRSRLEEPRGVEDKGVVNGKEKEVLD
ncbi:hypothetical protein HDU67_007943 [Dinochytrium kinnereticum]|nr:hypothetical protein HDU67_007943 [Dinochytrium kinnereticum]